MQSVKDKATEGYNYLYGKLFGSTENKEEPVIQNNNKEGKDD
jgi:hypothetical protein